MPLKFRSTGVAFSSEETSKDCTAWSGGWTIGYIYYREPEDDRDEPLTWIWSIHGVPGKPPGMRGHEARSLAGAGEHLGVNIPRCSVGSARSSSTSARACSSAAAPVMRS